MRGAINAASTRITMSNFKTLCLCGIPTRHLRSSTRYSAFVQVWCTGKERLKYTRMDGFKDSWLSKPFFSINQKQSVVIMQELKDSTMHEPFSPLSWNDVFGVLLPAIYGEQKETTIGRPLQETVAQSGYIIALNWVGKLSDFNSYLPVGTASHEAPLFMPHYCQMRRYRNRPACCGVSGP